MDLSETRQLLALISAIYQDKFTGNELLPAVWQECLSDIDANDAAKALKNYVKANEWPPQISHIREEVRLIHKAANARNLPKLEAPQDSLTPEKLAETRQKISDICSRIAVKKAMGWK